MHPRIFGLLKRFPVSQDWGRSMRVFREQAYGEGKESVWSGGMTRPEGYCAALGEGLRDVPVGEAELGLLPGGGAFGPSSTILGLM